MQMTSVMRKYLSYWRQSYVDKCLKTRQILHVAVFLRNNRNISKLVAILKYHDGTFGIFVGTGQMYLWSIRKVSSCHDTRCMLVGDSCWLSMEYQLECSGAETRIICDSYADSVVGDVLATQFSIKLCKMHRSNYDTFQVLAPSQRPCMV